MFWKSCCICKKTAVVAIALSAFFFDVQASEMPQGTGVEKRVDSPVDIWMIAQSGPSGKAVQGIYKTRHEILDTTDVKKGYFSVRFTVTKPPEQGAFGFNSGPYLDHWLNLQGGALHFWIKAMASGPSVPWDLVLYDAAGKQARQALDGMAADGQWREFTLPMQFLLRDEGFNDAAVRAVQVEAVLPKDAQVWMDDVFFKNGDMILGISDKTVSQYMAEAAITRAARVAEALSTGNTQPCQQFIASLYNGTDLEKTNREIIQWVQGGDDGPNGEWSLWTNSKVNWLLFGFSSKGRIKPGRLTPECEQALLAYYWKHLELKNDMATARQSSWWVTGSENHDVNMKAANLLSSQIFMHEPEYFRRIYPDLGRMQGYNYGEGAAFRVGDAVPVIKLGSGNYKDGKAYNAADHYKEWVVFWKEYIRQRAAYGFFIEHNADGYMGHTQRFLHDLYAWCEDEGLRQQVRMFIDLIWAQWAQDQVLGISGGAGTRGGPGWAKMGEMAQFLMGGPAGMGYFYGYSDYELPRQVWEMLLDRPGMGEYAYLSRKTNEAQDIWPHPPGTEYTMLIRPDSRLARYSWVTPDYVMGTRMDHPDALYCHLSASQEGVIFSTTPNAMIGWSAGYRIAVQHRGVVLLQPKRSVRWQHPAWFPGYTPATEPLKFVFGTDLDRIEERDGWIFVEEGNAYVAIRVIEPAVDTMETNAVKGNLLPSPVSFDPNGFGLFKPGIAACTWEEGGKPSKGRMRVARTLVVNGLYSPVIIEASRKAVHATFEDFQRDVLDNPIQLKQLIRSGFILTYRGCGSEAQELELNCANQAVPKIGGKHIGYDIPAFDSPFFEGASGSGVVTLTGPVSGSKLVLDFNRITRSEHAN